MGHHPFRAAGRRAAQILTAAAALAVLAGLTGGLPWLLIAAIGWPLPHHIPHLHQIPELLASPFDDKILLDALAVLAWIFWALFLRDLALEIAHATRDLATHRRTGQNPTRSSRTGPVRLVAALLVGAIAGSLLLNRLSTAAPRSAHPAGAAGSPVAAASPLKSTPATGATASATDGTNPRPARYAEPRPAAMSLPTTAAGCAVTTSAPSYTVVEGDNLWDIAGSHLGDPTRWREIYVLNRGHVQADGYALDDPDEIHIGWTLILPAVEPAAPKSPSSESSRSPHDEKPPPAGAEVKPTQPAPRDGQPGPRPEPSSTHDRHAAAQDGSHTDGVRMPSGAWIGTGLAAAFAATATTALLYRRRRTRLRWPTPAKTPGGVPRSLRAALDTGITALRTTDPVLAPIEEQAPSPQPDAPIGLDAAGNQASLEVLAVPGAALSGPGALAATRAVLAAALTAGISHDPSRRITILTDAELLNQLLPDGNPPEGLDPRGQALDGERLLIRSHPDEAVAEFERELLYRQRILAQYDQDIPDQAAEGIAMIAAMGLTTLITAAHPDQIARVRAVLDASAQLRLGAVLLGEAEHFTTIELDDHGTVTTKPADLSTPLTRMASLGAQELVDALDLARAATAVVDEQPPLQDLPTPGDSQSADRAVTRRAVPSAERSPAALVRLCVLGPPAVSTGNRPVNQITAGGHAVLAYLAAHPQGVTRDQALDELYPGVDTDPASQRFRTACKGVRSALRSATRDDTQWFIVYDSGRYRLDADVFDVDLWQMLAAIEHADQATSDSDTLTALRAAVDAYHGEFADGVTKSWVLEYATTYRNHVINVLARIAEIQETDQPDSALAALERAVTYDPVCEELYQRIMRIQGRLGRVAAVRQTLARCTEYLEAIQTEPSAATRRVADRQLRADAVTR